MFSLRSAAPIAVVFLIAGCQDHTTAPPPFGPVHVAIVSGDAQTGSAGQELPQPLVVRVVGSNGKGIRGQIVNFRVTAGGGRMYAGSSLTDMNGVAQDYWTLGVPGAQQVEVVAVEPTTGAKQIFGTFNATARMPASLTVAPSSSNFGTWGIGTTSGATVFTVQNIGEEPSGTLNVSIGGTHASDFSIGANACSGAALAAGATCTVSVTFSPSASGSRIATFAASALPGGTVSTPMSGTGAQTPALTINPASYSFGTLAVGSNSGSQTFTVINTGTAPATALAVSITGANSGDFSITGTNCTGVTLTPGQSCSGGILFAPTAAGARTATLNATASGGISRTAPLAGTGVSPAALSIAPAPFNYGSVTVGQSSVAQVFTVTNIGSSQTGVITTNITGTNAAEFTTGANFCIGLTLGPGQTCTVAVSFTPQANGTRSATFTAAASPGGSASAALTATGTGGAQLSILPASHNFGTVTVGGAPGTMLFTVTNMGSAATGAVQTTLTGTHAAQFQLGTNTCSGATLNAGASCTVIVALVPSIGGALAAALTVTASLGGTVSSVLTGTAIAVVSVSVSPMSLSFGNQAVRTTSASQTITITNIVAQSVQVFATLQGTASLDYFITNSCTTLAPGASCNITVVFTPTAIGARSAIVAITTSAGDAIQVTLSGTGI